MGFSVDISIPALTVFLQGLISFFSPCVLPLVPLYIGYLAGGTKTVDENGVIHYQRKKVAVNTLFFVLGVSFAFFALGFGFTAAGRFFSGNRALFAKIGGILVIMFGLYQMGLFGKSTLLGKERRLPFQINRLAMNPGLALLMGFTFSFAWTPCVGPALASVLLMATSANSAGMGMALIGVYTLGFVLPFLAVGLFTGSLLEFFKRHQKVVQYTVKAGGALMVLMGVMMWTGWMNGITGYLSQFGSAGGNVPKATEGSENPGQSGLPGSKGDGKIGSDGVGSGGAGSDGAGSSGGGSEGAGSGGAGSDGAGSDGAGSDKAGSDKGESDSAGTDGAGSDRDVVPAPDFTLTDQYGVEHKLSDYQGKYVFLNFWATWCGPCRQEMPDIQTLYEKYGLNEDELVILGVANPKTDQVPYNQDVTEEEIKAFLTKGGFTYPTVMDTTGEIFQKYYITSFPTTFMIDKDGNVFGYVSGTLTMEMMENIVKQTMEGRGNPES